MKQTHKFDELKIANVHLQNSEELNVIKTKTVGNSRQHESAQVSTLSVQGTRIDETGTSKEVLQSPQNTEPYRDIKITHKQRGENSNKKEEPISDQTKAAYFKPRQNY